MRLPVESCEDRGRNARVVPFVLRGFAAKGTTSINVSALPHGEVFYVA